MKQIYIKRIKQMTSHEFFSHIVDIEIGEIYRRSVFFFVISKKWRSRRAFFFPYLYTVASFGSVALHARVSPLMCDFCRCARDIYMYIYSMWAQDMSSSMMISWSPKKKIKRTSYLLYITLSFALVDV